jgi:hypothetical protein
MGKVSLYCKDCNVEIFVDVNMVILKDVIWEKISDKHEDSYCDCCIEKRLGRPIAIEDFKTPTMGVDFKGKNMIYCNACWVIKQVKQEKEVPLTVAKSFEMSMNSNRNINGKND